MSYSQAETIKVGAGIRGIHLIVGLILFVVGIFFAKWASDTTRVRQFLSSFESFKIQVVDVKAEWPLEVQTVSSWLSGVKGQTLFLVDSKQLAAGIQSKPWVESVAIKKSYPNRLQVSLVTKKPQALIIHKGQPWFVDPQGILIERATPALLRGLELPFLSYEASQPKWQVGQVLHQYEKMKLASKNKFVVSQIVLGSYPYFKTFLSQPKIEVWWSLENWESQLQNLIALIDNPPSQIGQLRRINLVFPKKAIVSSSISH